MNKQLIAAILAGALAVPASMVAQADNHDASDGGEEPVVPAPEDEGMALPPSVVMSGSGFNLALEGRVVAGLDWEDTDRAGESATWDWGATGFDGSRNQGSRLGFRADRDLGNGLSAGLLLVSQFEGGGGPNEQRHRYVYLSGGFGTLSLGNTDTPHSNAGYDQSVFLGGSFRNGSDRREGLHYTHSIGNLNFGVSLTGDNGDAAAGSRTDLEADDITDAARLAYNIANPADGGTIGTATKAQIATALNAENAEDNAAAARIADEDVDRIIVGGGYDFGAFRVDAAYDGDNTDTDRDITNLLVSGTYGPLDYFVGYEQGDDATPDGENDLSSWSLFLAYNATESDKFYFAYDSQDDDQANAGPTEMVNGTATTNEEGTAILLGYRHQFGGGTDFVAEYRRLSYDDDAVGDPSRLALAMIVNF